MTARRKVVVFLPAHNEGMNIASVISRIPRHFDPYVDVEVIVVNDGSSDDTVAVARHAGADHVVTFEKNQGLGAAVREGLRQCCLREADVGLMIDADNEYPPEQIPDLVLPILRGEVDYTMGSRFKGVISGMTLIRRIGNYGFTALQSLLLRRWIWDGQSGMRGFSREAMESSRIVHDYNYAQVITLNLVRQGFRMLEVPIVYQVRSKGESFIKFRAYVCRVLPAIWKELSTPIPPRKREQEAGTNHDMSSMDRSKMTLLMKEGRE